MPDKITIDDALGRQSSALGRITIDEALAEREAQTRPVVGEQGQQLYGMMGQPLSRAPELLPPEDSNFVASFKTAIPQDPETQLRVLAQQLFPNDPRARERVGFADGVPVYVDDAGQLRRVSGKVSGFFAEAAANLPEIIGGALGAFVPGHPVAGATLGSMGGRGIKRIASELVFGEPATPKSVATEMATEGALNLATAGAGRLGANFIGRGRIIDFSPANIRNAEQVREYVERTTGIRLDLAQASGDAKLISLRNYAARYPGKTAEVIQAANEASLGQFDQATQRVLDLVANAAPSEFLGQQGVNAATLAIRAARQKAYNEVRPLYEAAYAAKPQVTNPRLLAMLELPHFKEAFAAGQRIAKLEGVALKPDEPPDLRALDLTKQGLDDRIDQLMLKGRRSEARALKAKRDEFVAFLDNVTDDKYQLARQRYAELIEQNVRPLEEGPVGVLASIKYSKNATAAAKVFSDPNVTPEQLSLTKAVLSRQEPEAYRGLVRQWLAQQYNRALKETQTGAVVNAPGKFRQAVYGTPEARARMKALLPGDAAQAFEDLMLAAEKLASTPIRGSDTAFNQQITEQLKGRALAALSWIISPRERARTIAEERAMQQGLEALTDALVDPSKRRQLRQITKMSDQTKQLIQLHALLGGQAIAIGASDEDERLPPLLRQGAPLSGSQLQTPVPP